MFTEKVVIGPQKSFSHTDLLEYVEVLLKQSKQNERNLGQSNYSWLKSRDHGSQYSEELEELEPVVQKMTSESCAAISVKLDKLTEDVTTMTPHVILTAFKKLLEEQYSIQLIDSRLKRANETKHTKSKRNKVHPELSPPGRQATVSFILNEL